MWDLKHLVEVPSSVRQHAFHDPVSAAMWITQKDDTSQTLCFGTGLGYLIFWHQSTKSNPVRIIVATMRNLMMPLQMQFKELVMKRVGTGCEITCMTCDMTVETGVRIATGTRECQVICWTFHNNILVPTFSIQLSTMAPKGIAFMYEQKDVYIWGMYDGQMWATDLTDILVPNEYLKAYNSRRQDNH